MPRSFKNLRWLPFALLAALLGCGSGEERLAVVSVKGKVTVKGQPAAGASVMFVPVDQTGLRKTLRPRARCDEQGNFTLTTYDPGDGAPSGEYRVSIRWRGPSPDFAGREVPEEEKHTGPDQLQERYADAGNSGLAATVGPSATELAPFALK